MWSSQIVSSASSPKSTPSNAQRPARTAPPGSQNGHVSSGHVAADPVASSRLQSLDSTGATVIVPRGEHPAALPASGFSLIRRGIIRE